MAESSPVSVGLHREGLIFIVQVFKRTNAPLKGVLRVI